VISPVIPMPMAISGLNPTRDGSSRTRATSDQVRVVTATFATDPPLPEIRRVSPSRSGGVPSKSW
jgi:hypothetical protein